jgi:threonine-phosphate decarboxylase
LIAGPTYSDYADACHLHHVETAFTLAEASNNFKFDIHQMKTRLDQADAVFICNPNNPTGSLIWPDELKFLCRSYPDTVFIIDESYLPFVPGGDALSLGSLDSGNLLVLSSISKIFAIPGLRIGFVISNVQIINKFRRFLQPWSVNSLAQLAVHYLSASKDDVAAFIQKTHRYIRAEQHRFLEAAKDFSDIHLFPSTTNFMLLQLPYGIQAENVIDRLSQDKILIRNCHNFNGLSNRYIRISLKTSEANHLLAQKLSATTWKTIAEHQISDAKIRIAG